MKRYITGPRFFVLTMAVLCLPNLISCAQAPDPDVEKAKTFLDLGDYENACVHLERAIHTSPSNAEAHFLLGDANLQLGYNKARVHFERAREATSSRERQTHIERGQEQARLGEAKALGSYRAAIQLGLRDGAERLLSKVRTGIEDIRTRGDAEDELLASLLTLAAEADSTTPWVSYEQARLAIAQAEVDGRFEHDWLAVLHSRNALGEALSLSNQRDLVDSVAAVVAAYPVLLARSYMTGLCGWPAGPVVVGPVILSPRADKVFYVDAPRHDGGYVPKEARVSVYEPRSNVVSSATALPHTSNRPSDTFDVFPDGDHLLLCDFPSVYRYHVTSGKKTKVAAAEAGEEVRVAPDGHAVVFTRVVKTGSVPTTRADVLRRSEVFVADFGQSPRRLTVNEKLEWSPAFVSSGRIVFGTTHDSVAVVIEYDLATGDERTLCQLGPSDEFAGRIERGDHQAYAFDVSEDMQWVAFRGGPWGPLILLNLSTGARYKVDAPCGRPRFAPRTWRGRFGRDRDAERLVVLAWGMGWCIDIENFLRIQTITAGKQLDHASLVACFRDLY